MVEITHIKDLAPDPRNARKHNPRNIAMIERSIQECGFVRSIAIDENNQIVAGKGTTEAAGNVGMTKVRVIDAEPDELIAVRRKFVSDEQRKKAALYDNRTAELAEWDESEIALIEEEGSVDLSALFSDSELDAIREQIDKEDPGTEKPEMEFTEELLEEHQYVVLYFTNSIDWKTAQEELDIKPVAALDSKEGYKRVGTGRVIRGAEVIRRLQESR